MLDQVLDLFKIKPDYDLNIMKAGQALYDVTTKALMGLKEVMDEAKPDMVLVHGDTTTTFAGALAAFYAQIPVGHVEAGLRTGNKYSPYPEEMNRKLTGAIADMNFAPTSTSKGNLLKENVNPASIIVTGNTVIDALLETEADRVLSVVDESVRVAEELRRGRDRVRHDVRAVRVNERIGEIGGIGRRCLRLNLFIVSLLAIVKSLRLYKFEPRNLNSKNRQNALNNNK